MENRRNSMNTNSKEDIGGINTTPGIASMSLEEKVAPDFDKVRVYNLEPNVYPPYVLDSIAKAHHRDNDRSDLLPMTSSSVRRSVTQDLFLSSINSNWNSFLKTIETKSSNLFKPKVIPLQKVESANQTSSSSDFDVEYKLPDLNGEWGGDQRLKKILNEEVKDSDFEKSRKYKYWFHDKDMNDEYSPKIRSSAKYWMSTEQRVHWKPAIKRILVFDPYLIVSLRSLTSVFTIIALAFAVTIYKRSRQITNQQPSTIMAIIVETIAVVYLFLITWDEYSGKQIGLRNPMDKIKLIMLDLLFIIFSSANLSLSYNTLYDDRWLCVVSGSTPKVQSICERQRALSAFLFISLVMWVVTFAISIFRVVSRVSGPTN